jgi:hypothetical protein
MFIQHFVYAFTYAYDAYSCAFTFALFLWNIESIQINIKLYEKTHNRATQAKGKESTNAETRFLNC